MLTAAVRRSMRPRFWKSFPSSLTMSSVLNPESLVRRDPEEQHKYTPSSEPIQLVRYSSTATANNSNDTNPSLRQRSGEMRQQASQRWKEFRSNPKGGAKAFGSMMRRYGPVFVGTYFCVYVSTLSLLFLGVESGILDPVSLFKFLGSNDGSLSAKSTVDLVLDFMKNHTITKPAVPYVEENPALANLAVAWIAVKFTEPVRLPTALFLTPRVARIIGYRNPQAEEEEEEGQEESSDIPSGQKQQASSDGNDDAAKSSSKNQP